MDHSPADIAKRAAATRALRMVEDGMTLGLGTGSTAAWFVRLLAERVAAEGLKVTGVATSSATVRLCAEVGLPLTALEEAGPIDLTVDGADEFDPDLNLIKGGGAALLQEKIVAASSRRMVVVADGGKRVGRLGAFPLPVEIVRFGWSVTKHAVEAVLTDMDVDARRVVLRMDGDAALVTDEGHHILDLHLGRIGNAPALAAALNAVPGVVESGLFIGMADTVIVGLEDGAVEVLRRVPVGVAEEMMNQDA